MLKIADFTNVPFTQIQFSNCCDYTVTVNIEYPILNQPALKMLSECTTWHVAGISKFDTDLSNTQWHPIS
jgi:hypothetical protein